MVCATCISVAAQEKQEKQEKYGTLYLYREVDTQDYGTQIVILNPEAVVYLDYQDPTVKGEPETCTGKVKLKTFEAIRTTQLGRESHDSAGRLMHVDSLLVQGISGRRGVIEVASKIQPGLALTAISAGAIGVILLVASVVPVPFRPESEAELGSCRGAGFHWN